MITFETLNGAKGALTHEIGIKFDRAAGRLAAYLRLQGKSNCPYERAGVDALIAEEKENLRVFRLQLDELTKCK